MPLLLSTHRYCSTLLSTAPPPSSSCYLNIQLCSSSSSASSYQRPVVLHPGDAAPQRNGSGRSRTNTPRIPSALDHRSFIPSWGRGGADHWVATHRRRPVPRAPHATGGPSTLPAGAPPPLRRALPSPQPSSSPPLCPDPASSNPVLPRRGGPPPCSSPATPSTSPLRHESTSPARFTATQRPRATHAPGRRLVTRSSPSPDVVVTREQGKNAKLVAALEKHNVHSLELPLIQHVEGPDTDRLSAVLRGMWFSPSFTVRWARECAGRAFQRPWSSSASEAELPSASGPFSVFSLRGTPPAGWLAPAWPSRRRLGREVGNQAEERGDRLGHAGTSTGADAATCRPSANARLSPPTHRGGSPWAPCPCVPRPRRYRQRPDIVLPRPSPGETASIPCRVVVESPSPPPPRTSSHSRRLRARQPPAPPSYPATGAFVPRLAHLGRSQRPSRRLSPGLGRRVRPAVKNEISCRSTGGLCKEMKCFLTY